jgi:hypothetical protein
MHHRMPPSKTWVAQFKSGDFSTFFPLVGLRTYQHPGSREEGSFQLLRGGSLKSHIVSVLLKIQLNSLLLLHMYCIHCLQPVYVSAHLEPSSTRQIHGSICEVLNYVTDRYTSVSLHKV